MVLFNSKNRQLYIVIGLVAFFSLFALWLRILPMLLMGNTDILMMVASDDPLYNLRQAEQILANFPNYAWFDPMTLYPTGSNIYWGPLFPTIIATGCLLTGAVTRPEIIGIGLLVPPLMGMLTVIIMYFIGKTCGDYKTGLLASGFTAIVSGQFFYRSFYGYIDHHIAEVLFSTIFCLIYMYILLSEKNQKIDLKDINTYKKTILFSVLTGIAYLLGLFTMPTMILFAMIVGIFTIVQFIYDVHRHRTSEYLLIINITIFVIATLGLLLFGFKNQGLDLSAYTIGHAYAYIGLIGGTIFLYLTALYLKNKPWYYFPGALLGTGVAASLILFIAAPQIFNLLISSFFAFFGQAAVTNTVQEARGWSLENAWITFNYGLLLMIGGILIMIYNNIREEYPEQVFALVWSLIILFSTWQHIRYEYYLAINVALLSAVCVSFTCKMGWKDLCRLFSHQLSEKESGNVTQSDDSPRAKKQKKTTKGGHVEVRNTNIAAVVSVILIGIISILFIYSSVSLSYDSATSSGFRMNGDWKESLDWMGNNTPATGVDYDTIYNKDTFTYPAGSYGVMSWWDYGHMITYIAKRIPNANPFQQGVAGDIGSAAYFTSTSEDTANNILDHVGTRYVITDIEMDTGKFWAMATWANATLSTEPYMVTMFTPSQDNSGALESVQLNNQQYYLTTVSRLHNFDGSMTDPTTVYYIEYADPEIYRVSLPVITNAEAMNATAAKQKAEQYNLKAQNGYHATALSPSIVLPIDQVPALRHYRLVHESPNNIFSRSTYDVKYVKVFEYVKGAHIKGDGIIEVPVITNTGRNFTYRQASINGEFIIPYSTTGNQYNVKTTGKYTIVGTGKQYDVSEDAVMQGLTIQ
jgi:dolichyl-diphosphooligosaccharide--protein glycosyltransferase